MQSKNPTIIFEVKYYEYGHIQYIAWIILDDREALYCFGVVLSLDEMDCD